MTRPNELEPYTIDTSDLDFDPDALRRKYIEERDKRLRSDGFAAPVCIGVHALFSGDADAVLLASGATQVVSCNTVPHPSNAIDLEPALAQATRELARHGAATA